MEPSETVLNSYYHHHNTQPPPPPPPPLNSSSPPPPPVNGALSSSAAKKRGRPRKYATPEEAAAARRLQLAAQPKKVRTATVSPVADVGQFSPTLPASAPASKLAPLAGFGNVGQSFTPHIISVAAGEDVYQKIMLFMQQSKREICILSASGSVSSPFLRQPATSGGNVTYEGRFDILSLSGSYIRTDLGGRTGGLSVCLSSVDGQIIGGGIGGPLRAAGPVEVIVGTFQIDAKKDLVSGSKGIEQMA